MKYLILLALTFCAFAQDDETTYDMDEISKKIENNIDKCYPGEGEGHAMPGGCGCDYPNEFCFWFASPTNGLTEPTIECMELSDECKSAVEGDTGDSTDGAATTAKPSDDATTPTTPTGGNGGVTTPAAGGNGGVAPGPGGGAGGGDYHDYCCWWAQQGECDKNPYFMKPVCQKSCGTPGCTVQTATTCTTALNVAGCKWGSGGGGGGTGGGTGTGGTGGGGGMGGCADTHMFCSFWASVGECQKNAAWMRTGCGKSCQAC